jgi:hypothetical protein
MSKRQTMLFMTRIDGAGNLWEKEPEINLTIPCSEKLLGKIDRAREIMGIDKRGESLTLLIEEMVELYLHTHDPYLKAQRSMARQEQREAKKRTLEDLCYQREESAMLHSGMTGEGQAKHQKEPLHPGMAGESEIAREKEKETQLPEMKEDATPDGHSLTWVADGSDTKPSSRYIPASVRHAVMLRDGGRCTFVAADGRRCEAVSGLEFDHIHSFACGGSHEENNLRLRCRAHTLFWAEQSYGASFIKQKVEEKRRSFLCSS